MSDSELSTTHFAIGDPAKSQFKYPDVHVYRFEERFALELPVNECFSPGEISAATIEGLACILSDCWFENVQVVNGSVFGLSLLPEEFRDLQRLVDVRHE